VNVGENDAKPEGLSELEQLAAEQHPGISIAIDPSGEMHDDGKPDEGAALEQLAADEPDADEALAALAADDVDAAPAPEVGDLCPVTHATGEKCLRLVPGHKRHFGGNIGWWD
jgi:hypothetical protein